MNRIVIALSASITAFILALTAGAIYAYSSTWGPNLTVQRQQPASQPVSQTASSLQLMAPPAVVPMPKVAPQDAASMAARAINRTDLYSIELADYQGSQVYKVTFSSGDIVYVSMDGQVLGTEAPPAPAPVFVTQSGGGGAHHGGSDGGSTGGDEHDDHEGEGD